MDKYINLDDLITQLANCENQKFLPTSCSMIKFIENFPIADVVEVRHGRWNLNRKLIFLGDDFGHWRCSECGCEATFGNRRDIERYRYCSNCGAKMDGGQNE